MIGSLTLGASVLPAAETWRLTNVETAGSTEYAAEEILRVAGLTVGSDVGVEDFRNAARRLADTGAFANVAFRYETLEEVVGVTFTVQDADRYLPIRFENFVWASDEGLLAYLSEHLPLFSGTVTTRESSVKRVEAALAEWLANRGLPGRVARGFYSPDEGKTIGAASYTVEGVPMPVREVHLSNAPNLDDRDREQLTRMLMASPYRRSAAMETARLHLAPAYGRKGMLRAKFERPEVRLVGANPLAPEIALTIPVVEGRRYTVAGIEWKEPVSEEVAALVPVEPGAVADESRLQEGLSAIRGHLTSAGHLRAGVDVEHRINDGDGTVGYRIDVRPGPLCRMGTVEFAGVTAEEQAKLLKKWKLKPGEPYDPGYFMEFFKGSAFVVGRRSVKTETKLTDDNLVHLTVRFE